MSENKQAYRTENLVILKTWDEWTKGMAQIRDKRGALIDTMGRNLYVQGRNPSRVVGFETFDDEIQGDLIHNGSLRVNKTGIATPNLKRKAGKDFAAELATLTNPVLSLPGMPAFHVSAQDGEMYVLNPALFLHEAHGGEVRVIYALWNCTDAPVDKNLWQPIKLSAYYAAKETYDAQQEGK